MARSWLVDSRAIARKVKNAALPSANQIKDCGAKRECPNCHHVIDNKDMSHEWPGLPFGVKFDPSDIELLEHLGAKCGVGDSKQHNLIDEFIPTLDVDEGICYQHPEKLPGSRKDGSSVHFFHRTTNAYATGQRKRRKIHSESSSTNDNVRWHKTGKTKAIMQNGIQKGCKKIMVLYGKSVKGSKPDKSNWVMHQYHLGTDEDEKEGQYVVSKIFYQLHKETEKNDNHVVTEEFDAWMSRTSPRTPKTDAPNPPRPGNSISCEDVLDDYLLQSPAQESKDGIKESCCPSSFNAECKDGMEYPSWGDDSQAEAVDLNDIDYTLFCKENLNSNAPCSDSRLNRVPSSSRPVDLNETLYCNEMLDSHAPTGDSGMNLTNDVSGVDRGASCGIADLENLELDTPPEFSLADLQFCSQESIFGLLDRL